MYTVKWERILLQGGRGATDFRVLGRLDSAKDEASAGQLALAL